MGYGVGRFERRDNPFEFSQRAERRQRFLIGCIVVIDPVEVAEIAVLRPYGCVVQAGGYGVGQFDLPILVGKQPGFRTLQHPKFSALKAGGMPAAHDAFAASFDSNHLHGFVAEKRVKETNRIASTADTGHQQVRE
jgi:hypothetical protein